MNMTPLEQKIFIKADIDSYSKVMSLEDFAKLKIDILDAVTITESNVSSKLLAYPKIFTRFLNIFIKESLKLKNLKVSLEEKYGDIYKEYKDGKGNVLLKNNEIEIYINRELDYAKLKKDYNQQEMICQFLEEYIGMLKNMSYAMKDYVNFTIWQAGGK